MMTYFTSSPAWLRFFYPSLIWKIKTTQQKIYLTFDDGPHPTITPFVLNELKKYNATATFFCVGNNVEKYPETYQRIIAEGHTVANHTHHHVNGWKTSTEKYLQEFQLTEKIIGTKIFRPPYGKIRAAQIKAITAQAKIIMWNRLSGDFDKSISNEKCLQNVIGKPLHGGDIILFHDSEKAYERLQFALPETLNYIYQSGFTAEKIIYDDL